MTPDFGDLQNEAETIARDHQDAEQAKMRLGVKILMLLPVEGGHYQKAFDLLYRAALNEIELLQIGATSEQSVIRDYCKGLLSALAKAAQGLPYTDGS
jgi:hypothetical protein